MTLQRLSMNAPEHLPTPRRPLLEQGGHHANPAPQTQGPHVAVVALLSRLLAVDVDSVLASLGLTPSTTVLRSPDLTEQLVDGLGGACHAGSRWAMVLVVPPAPARAPEPDSTIQAAPSRPESSTGRPSPRVGSISRLTARELEVLKLVADGRTNHEIAAALWISPKTASVHVSHILTKLGTSTRAGAAGIGHRSGILDS